MRIAKVPQAWTVILFLIVLPSFYTWFNMVGFWDPYANTGNLRVCVVNEDIGCHDETLGDLDLGTSIAEQLEQNDQLGWALVSYEEAHQEVLSGEAWAAIVIPRNFSSQVASLVNGNLEHPQVEYYVNEKLNPITPKVTDTGASTLETTINDQFVSTASGAITAAVDKGLNDLSDDLDTAQKNATRSLSKVIDAISTARTSLGELSASAQKAAKKVSKAQKKAEGIEGKIDDSAENLDKVSKLASSIGKTASSISSELASSSDVSSLELTQAATNAQLAIAHAAASIETANVEISSSIRQAKSIIETNQKILDSLKEDLALLPDGDVKEKLQKVIDDVEEKNTSAKTLVEDLETAAADIKTTADSLGAISSQLIEASKDAVEASKGVRDAVAKQAIPALVTATTQIESACGSIKTALVAQKVVAKNLAATLSNLESTLMMASTTIAGTASTLEPVETELKALRTDIAIISLPEAISKYLDEGGLDASKVADFMASPTTVSQETLYPVSSYGSAMAPLLINLTLWIGSLMLLVILKIEVDGEGLPKLKPKERYFGRWLLFAVCSIMQAVVCSIGCMVLGVQLSSVPFFFLTTIVIALAYLSIQYALTASFQHVGKGMIIVIAFLQIPAATGLYPVEMTTLFFRAIYPIFPFTYGINAVREVICGFYANTWATCMLTLIGFAVVFTLAAILARPYLINLNRLFARQIKQTEIINGENAEQPARRYSLPRMILAIADIEGYSKALDVRIKRFMRFYSVMRLMVFGLTAALLVASTVLLHFLHAEKVVILTVWVVLLFLMALVLIFGEYTYNSLSHEVSVRKMSAKQISELAAEGGTAPDEVREKARAKAQAKARTKAQAKAKHAAKPGPKHAAKSNSARTGSSGPKHAAGNNQGSLRDGNASGAPGAPRMSESEVER